MFAFYAVRGYKPSELANLTETEKIFLYCAMEQFYNEEAEKYKALFGVRG